MIVREVRYGSDRYREVLALRDRILRAPLGLTWSKEDLEGEAEQLHFALVDESETPIACVAVKPLDADTAKVRQMAVDESCRGIGAGRQMLQGVEEILRQRGFRRIEMDARKEAVGFYRKLGYEIDGDEFIQVTIPHYRMTREI